MFYLKYQNGLKCTKDFRYLYFCLIIPNFLAVFTQKLLQF